MKKVMNKVMNKVVLIIVIFITLLLAAYMFIANIQFEQLYDTEVQVKNVDILNVDIFTEQQRISHQIDTEGPQSAYDAYKERYAGYDFGTQHALAHIMGELLYQKEGIEGLTICDASFAFGCYHSFFGEAIRNEGTEIIEELDRTCIEAYGPLGTGCQHGIGHGIVEYMGRENLTPALELCERLLYHPSPIFGCPQGVFMELFTPIIFEYESGRYVDTYNIILESYNPDNPYAPCTSVPERFQASCYYEISNWWSTIFSNEYTHVASLCSQVPPKYQSSCFIGLGHMVTDKEFFDIGVIRNFCDSLSQFSHDAVGSCKIGASLRLHGTGEKAHKESANQLCKSVRESLGTFRCEMK